MTLHTYNFHCTKTHFGHFFLFEKFSSAASNNWWCTGHCNACHTTTLGSTLGALAFAWNMFLNVPLIADWQVIARTYEHHVNEDSWCANRKQCQFDYAPGQQVLKKVHNPTKLGVIREGPYTIERVHVNGNLTILLHEGITERINIRRILPYHWPFHIPLWRQILARIVFEVFTFYLWSFSPPHIWVSCRWSLLDPVSVCSSMAAQVLPWRERVFCPWK